LGIYAGWPVFLEDGRVCTEGSHGKYINEFLKHVDQLILFCPKTKLRTNTLDFAIEDHRLKVIDIPFYLRYIESVKHFNRIRIALKKFGKSCDAFYIRFPDPFAWLPALYYPQKALLFHIVGDAFHTIRTNLSYSWLKRFLLCSGYFPEYLIGRRMLRKNPFIVTGFKNFYKYRELNANSYPVISTTLVKDDFFKRNNTCNGKTIRLLYVGYLRGSKGLDILIDAFELLLKKEYSVHLHIVGDGEYKESLKTKIKMIGLSNKIFFKGYVGQGTSLQKEYRNADIFVFPSLSETGPRVILEAMANSLPIVTTRVGWVAHLIENGIHAITVKTGDSKALFSGIEMMINNNFLREKCIKNGFYFAKDKRIDNFIENIVVQLKNQLYQL
jgi:glycosyltransferase involved in cell wall biosynthesis